MANPNWVKGVSGNPSGKPKGAKGIAELIRIRTKDYRLVVDKMFTIGLDDDRGRDQVEALKWLADRGLGRAAESTDGNGIETLRKLMFVPKVQFELVKEANAEIVQETQVDAPADASTASPAPRTATISPQDVPKAQP